MFNWFKKKKNTSEEIEYSFIWYKKMQTANKTIYTQPFRTRVKAASFEEAKEKAIQFALGKMQLVIVSEDKFDKTDLASIDKHFSEINKKMDDINKHMDSMFFKK